MNNSDFMSHLNYADYEVICDGWFKDIHNGTYDIIDMVSNNFVNAITYQTKVRRRMPFDLLEILNTDSKMEDFILMPNKKILIEQIVPLSIKVRTYMRFAESVASENAARMTAMHKATENATVLLKDLKLKYNKARQFAITSEIIEITTAANALKAL